MQVRPKLLQRREQDATRSVVERLAAENTSEVVDPLLVGFAAVLDRQCAELSGRFEELWVVHQHQRSQRCVRALAADARAGAIRRIKRRHIRRRCHPLPIRVQAAAVEIGPLVPLIKCIGADAFPHVGRLVRLDARSTDPLDQQTGSLQRRIAQHLGVHPEARATGEQTVLRIALDVFGGRLDRLPIRRRHDEHLVQPLDLPPVFDEIDGEPVEQLGVRRPAAHQAQVATGFDEAGAKHFLPHPVDGDAGRERVVG